MKLPEESRTDEVSPVERAARYIAKMDPAVSGDGGHSSLFKVAIKLKKGFALDDVDTMSLLQQYNLRCQPPWTERELQHKIDQAKKQPGESGFLLGDTPPWEKPLGSTHTPSGAPSAPTPTEGMLGVLGALMGRLREGIGDAVYEAGSPFDGLEVGPGKITVIGAPPGAGKTAMTMQFVFQFLERNPDRSVLVANAEMTPEMLLRRELTRLSGVNGHALRFAKLTDIQLQDVERAAKRLTPLLDRIKTIPGPYGQKTLMNLPDESAGDLLVLDYLQKFADGEDLRRSVGDVMSSMRVLAMGGYGILALSSVTRLKDKEKLSMSSFKESGEIEFNADAAYLMLDRGEVDGDPFVRDMQLRCAKNRHGACQDLELIFDKPSMSFRVAIKPYQEFADYATERDF